MSTSAPVATAERPATAVPVTEPRCDERPVEHVDGRLERRRSPRIRAPFHARLGLPSERVTGLLDAVDVSETGILLVAAEPLGARPDDRVCLTLITPSGNLHRLGRVVRVARGSDFRSYVAIEYAEPFDPEIATILDSLRHADDTIVAAAAAAPLRAGTPECTGVMTAAPDDETRRSGPQLGRSCAPLAG